MNQSSSIIVFLLIGFIVYITVQGEIPEYKEAVFGTDLLSDAGNAIGGVLTDLGGALPSLPNLPQL